MKKDFDDAILRAAKVEEAKQLFGGELYTKSYKLPSLHISKENEDEENTCYNTDFFISSVSYINNIANSCGNDMALLMGEVFILYGIDTTNENLVDVTQEQAMIILLAKTTFANLSLCSEQSNELLEILGSYDFSNNATLEVTGKDYCFISLVLNELFYSYATILNFLIKKRYLNDEFIKSISERLDLIISSEFDALRRIFKTVECYREVEEKPTLH